MLIILESHITAKNISGMSVSLCLYLCFVLIFRDLRGNKFECDCKAKWLYLWLKMTNSTVSDVLCIGPPEYQEKKLNDVTSFDYECTTTGTECLCHWRLLFRIFPLCFSFRLSTGSGETWVKAKVFYQDYVRQNLSLLKDTNLCVRKLCQQFRFSFTALAFILILFDCLQNSNFSKDFFKGQSIN